MVGRGDCSPCVECRSVDDGIIGRRAVDNQKGVFLGELLRISANGHW